MSRSDVVGPVGSSWHVGEAAGARVIRPARATARPDSGGGARAGLFAIGLLLVLGGGAGVAGLLTSEATAVRLVGIGLGLLVAAGIVAAVLVLGHPRRDRFLVRVEPDRLVLPHPPAVPWVARIVSTLAVLLAVPVLIALASGQRAELPAFGTFSLLGVAAIAAPAAVRAWRGSGRGTALVLDRTGVRFVSPRGVQQLAWGEVRTVAIEGIRLRVRGTIGSGAAAVDLGVRDLGSDPRLVADLIEFYARQPAARAEIGDGSLDRLRHGDLR